MKLNVLAGRPNPIFTVVDDSWDMESQYVDVASFADWDEANEFAFMRCGPNAYIDRYEECTHGLSMWLCADPINHYGRD